MAGNADDLRIAIQQTAEKSTTAKFVIRIVDGIFGMVMGHHEDRLAAIARDGLVDCRFQQFDIALAVARGVIQRKRDKIVASDDSVYELFAGSVTENGIEARQADTA